MKVGVIVPDRGDRPQFSNHLRKMLENQTRKADFVLFVDYLPKSDNYDLTERVRTGFETLRGVCDCVLIMENDDYYSPEYIETMVSEWVKSGKPDLLGISYTIYYHLFQKKYNLLQHPNRSSLMSTLINCKANINWCGDNFLFLDLHLFKNHSPKLFAPDEPISIGIKHGIGKCGGVGHTTMRYNYSDDLFFFLKSNVDKESFKFYSEL